MKSKRSFFNGMIFRKNLEHLWPLWMIYTIVLLLMVPANILANLNFSYSGYTEAELQQLRLNNYVFSLFRGIGYEWKSLVTAVAATIIAMAVFRYLFQERSAQAYHAMPLSRRELFFSNYLAGLTMLLVPALLAFFGGVIVTVLSGITALEYLLAWLLIFSGECFFFYSMAVLICMFTGQLWVVPVFQLIFNVLFIGVRYLVTSLMGTIGYGLSQSYANRQNSIFSPLIFMINRIGLRYKENYDSWDMVNYEFEIVGFRYLGIYVVVALVMSALAYLLYLRRKIEMTGDVLSIWETRPLFRWGVAVCGAFLCGMCAFGLLSNWIRTPRAGFVVVLVAVVLGALFCFFAAQMLLEKRIAVFQKKRIGEGLICCFLCSIFVISIKCNAFGLETKIPDADEIVSARVSMFYQVDLETPEGIETIRRIHRSIIDSKDEFLAYQSDFALSDDVRWTEIDYVLKDGSRMVRSYGVPISAAYMENQDSVASVIYGLSMDPENYLRGNIGKDYDKIKIQSMSIDLYRSDLEETYIDLTDAQAQQIYNAYIKDIRQGHIVLWTNDEVWEKNYYMNSLMMEYTTDKGARDFTYTNLSLNSQCSYTIELLKRMGIINEEQRLITWPEYERISKEMQDE
ncbi:MAG: ABC transporter permease [Lachnospiraceae bacterium]|nr:ABC transporter permease [Lachnospiraceae bacterium]